MYIQNVLVLIICNSWYVYVPLSVKLICCNQKFQKYHMSYHCITFRFNVLVYSLNAVCEASVFMID